MCLSRVVWIEQFPTMLCPDHPKLSRVNMWNQLCRYLCRGCHPLNVALGSSYFSVIYIISCFSSLLHFKLAIAAMVYCMFVLIACVFSPPPTHTTPNVCFGSISQPQHKSALAYLLNLRAAVKKRKKRERERKKRYMEIPIDYTHLMHF